MDNLSHYILFQWLLLLWLKISIYIFSFILCAIKQGPRLLSVDCAGSQMMACNYWQGHSRVDDGVWPLAGSICDGWVILPEDGVWPLARSICDSWVILPRLSIVCSAAPSGRGCWVSVRRERGLCLHQILIFFQVHRLLVSTVHGTEQRILRLFY